MMQEVLAQTDNPSNGSWRPKSSEQKEKVRKASTDGISVQGHQGTRLLPEQLLSEAFILSDLFNIGELATLELLLAGEHQQAHFPGLTRGLVAVLLNWDGKRCIANSLRSLIQSRHSKTFTLELSTDVSCSVVFVKEVNSILQHVVERNRMRQSLSAKRHTLQSWRNLVETVLTACPQDLIPTEDRQLIIRDLLLDLHDKVGITERLFQTRD
ncbi:UNVERIFIED_CONTAM: hypothetical protein FKN15_067760 [Acipenser sinensis]